MMRNNLTPLISIVLNTRNRCDLLPRAINSALNQTYTNFELIVVDGSSTDNTKGVVNEFIKKDIRIKYLWCENRNGAYCINNGFKAAQGKYIAILDDDDEFLSTKLEKQVNLFESSDEKLGIVYCWEEFWDDRSNCLLRIGKEENRGHLYHKLLYGPCTGGGTLMMIRKSAIEKLGGYDDSIKLGCDYQFNLNISREYLHDYVPEILVRTHWFHKYTSLTTQSGSKGINYNHVIEYYLKILSDHKDSFILKPDAYIWYYKSIISASSKLHNYKLLLKYTMKGLSLKTNSKTKLFFIIAIVKRFLLSLINL